jgi:hypothetical protein
VAAAAAAALAACFGLGGEPSGPASISRLLLPAPGVVVGDTMRDSTGAAAPLRVIAFAASGATLAAQPTFVTLDTLVRLVAGNLLVGDYLGSARVVGGIGAVQAQPETVKVTLRPDTLVATDSVRHVRTYTLVGDTLVTSAELGTRVQNRQGASPADVDAVIVHYTVVRAPPPRGAVPTITVMNGSQVSSRDTTTGGRAGRTLRLRLSQLTSAADDSAVVVATAAYRGRSIGTVQFTVLFTKQ